MKKRIGLLLLGALLSMHTPPGAAEIVHRRWVIILTVIDLATGATLEERELDPSTRFDDLEHCKAIVSKAGPIPKSDHFRAVLTCRKVEGKEVTSPGSGGPLV